MGRRRRQPSAAMDEVDLELVEHQNELAELREETMYAHRLRRPTPRRPRRTQKTGVPRTCIETRIIALSHAKAELK